MMYDDYYAEISDIVHTAFVLDLLVLNPVFTSELLEIR